MILTRYYQTLNDIIGNHSDIQEDINVELETIYGVQDYPLRDQFNDSATQEAMTRAFAIYGDEYVQITDEENPDFTSFCKRILKWVESTYGYYKKLIAANTSYTDLAADVVTKEQHGFADLPQQEQFDIDPETADNKISTLDLSKRSEQYGTPMDRLKQIENGYNDPYHLWVLSFAREFVINPVEGLEVIYDK